MSADKRKKFLRACRFLHEVNTGDYPAPSLQGRGRWSVKNPTIRYIIAHGMARIVRVRIADGYYGAIRRTRLDTGIPWSRQTKRARTDNSGEPK